MKTQNFTLEIHGFTGHLVQPDRYKDTAVLVLTGNEKGLLPAARIAGRFAQYRHLSLAVPLCGADGMPEDPDRIPLDVLEPAVKFLREFKGIQYVAVYGASMGSLFALLAALYIPGIDQCVCVSGTHVVYEGSGENHTASGHSVVTWQGKELPFVRLDLSKDMRSAFEEAYQDSEQEAMAAVPVEDIPGSILILAADSDETWPADYSAKYMEKRMKKNREPDSFKVIIYKKASHILGLLPDESTQNWLYRFSRISYTSLRKYPKECVKALEQSQQEILTFLNHGRKVTLKTSAEQESSGKDKAPAAAK